MSGRRCIFLDRDGVINVSPPPGQYVSRWAEFELLPTVVDWIRLLNVLEFLVIVVTNQRGIARRLVRYEDVCDIHARMTALLAERGARIDDVLMCPHDVGQCDCRKPNVGLVVQAQQKWGIDVARSIVVGDADSDRELAARCGMRFVLVSGGRIVDTWEPDADPRRS